MDRILEREDGDYFIWDEEKNKRNIKKHGISFEEAITIFRDADYQTAPDLSDHNNTIAMGFSAKGKELFVVHCIRKIYKDIDHDDSEEGSQQEIEAIRIISARKVEAQEKRKKETIERSRKRGTSKR